MDGYNVINNFIVNAEDDGSSGVWAISHNCIYIYIHI